MTQKEENHVIAKKHGLLAIVLERNEDVPIHRTKGENRKRMKKYLPEECKKGQ